MKKALCITCCLLTAACTASVQQQKQISIAERTNELINKMEQTNDPLLVIDAYKNVYETKSPDFDILKLTEPNSKPECFENAYKSVYHSTRAYKNNTDECILYRRNTKESQVGFFDYQRFLGAKSIIKDDDSFLKLVQIYDRIKECDFLEEKTTIEKEQCKQDLRQNIKLRTEKTVTCMDAEQQGYTSLLKDVGYDYTSTIKQLEEEKRSRTQALLSMSEKERKKYTYDNYFKIAEMHETAMREQAHDKLLEKIQKFGKENLCTTTKWKQEIKSLGYPVK